MRLKDLKEGERLRLSKKGVVYIKGKHQGMYNQNVNLKSELMSNTRCQRPAYRHKLEHEYTICYPV